MLEVKALTKDFESWGEDYDDFYISFELDVGEHDVAGASDLFTFNIVSPKRLGTMAESTGVVIGHGNFIMSDFNIQNVEDTVDKIINKCRDDNSEEFIKNLSRYFRLQG
ncbi:Imm8 family immunity protein [Rossellomorea sp. AcN35-11]|nr:immunity 8 family protein [Rossellomorea aquimaris]WJV28382.1 Imm8 family immunity protein [Rossellomorea sp. AcN35-11]